VWKRLGKRSATGTSKSGNKFAGGVRGLGAGDGTVAMGTATMGDGRGAARMSLRVTYSLRLCPRC